MKYQNRIVGNGEEPLDQIMFNPRNWRIHPLYQQNALKGVLEEVGWVQQVIVNQRTGNLIDGHLRCQLAAREGNDTIPVVYVDLSEEEEALILSTLDPIAGMAATDKEKLDDLFRQFNSDNENVQKLIADIAEKEKLEFGKKPIEDAEPQIDKAEELRVKWGVELGQLWQLGEHRIICGDCTDRAVVERVMDGEKAHLMVTDPPYGVSYQDTGAGAWDEKKKALKRAGLLVPRFEKIENDELQGDTLFDFLLASFSVAVGICDPKAAWYVFHASKTQMIFEQALNEVGYIVRSQLIWYKTRPAFNFSQYKFQHEPLFYAFKDGESPYWYGDKAQVTVWEIKSDNGADYLHPTQKPVPIIEKAVGNSSTKGDIVYEPFCGSGTDILACESLSRKCRAIEISPAYVAVSIQRWVDATGGVPELMT